MQMYVQEEVHVQDNFTSKANMSNTTHLLQGKWIYVGKCGKISCLLNFGHIRAQIKSHVCTTFTGKVKPVNMSNTTHLFQG